MKFPLDYEIGKRLLPKLHRIINMSTHMSVGRWGMREGYLKFLIGNEAFKIRGWLDSLPKKREKCLRRGKPIDDDTLLGRS